MAPKSKKSGIKAAGRTDTRDVNIGIAADDRAEIAEALSRVLADTYTLYLKTHGYHWNVTGPMFNTLHTMFMAQYTELQGAVDLIAERIRALGHFAPGTFGLYGKLAAIPEDDGVPVAMDMVANLLAGHETLARTARHALSVAEKGDDAPTADLMTERMQISEKTAWMLRSILE